MVIISCKNEQNTVEPPSTENKYKLAGNVFSFKNGSKQFLESVSVRLNNDSVLTDTLGLFLFDSLSSGNYTLTIDEANFVEYDTSLGISADVNIEIELLEVANDISWMKTTGIEGRNFHLVSHPDGYILASEFNFADGGNLFRLTIGDSIWNNTGYDSIFAPLFIESNGSILSKTKISTDNGTTWIDNGIGPFTSFYEYDGLVYGSGYGPGTSQNSRFNFVYSSDYGTNWIRIDFAEWVPEPIVWCVIVNDLGEPFIFVHSGGLYKWLQDLQFAYIGSFGTEYQSAIKDGNGYLYFKDSRIRRSTDNGYSWQIISDIDNLGSGSWAINSKGHLYFGLAGIGIMRSVDNGDNWEIVNNNLPNLNIINLCIDEADFLYASMSSDGGIFRTKESTIRK